MGSPTEMGLLDGRELEAAGSEAEEMAPLRETNAAVPKARRWQLAVGTLLFSTLAAVVVATVSSRRSEVSTSTDPWFQEKVSTVKEIMKKKDPLPKPTECSMATVQNCNVSQCCDNFGFQCYAKNESFAACMDKCEPATLNKKGNGTWSCKPLGLKHRCAALSEDCSQFGCCATDGHQCFEQSKGKASCKKTCDPAVYGTQGWTCAMIGPRNTQKYGTGYYAGMVEVSPSVKKCSRIGESCASTKCCSWTGYSCYEKNSTWASCLTQCIPNKPNGGISNKMQFQAGSPEDNPPAHWKPFFQEAGPGPWTCKRLAPPMVHGWQRGVSLFCYTVALTENGGKKKVPELELVRAAQKAKSSIFACDKWVVYSNVEAPLSPGKTVKVDYPHAEGRRPNTKIFVNTKLFMNVWGDLKKQMTWPSFSWVVKADPPTVFIPSRLRTILGSQMVTPKGVYMENCDLVRMSFHGSLEVISKDAFGTFLDNIDECDKNLPWKHGDHAHFRYYGEDKFLQWCMDRHGVDKVPSRQMVDTVPKDEKIYGLHLTVSCPGHRTKFERQMKKWKPNCTRSVTASMHSFKTVKDYLECLKNTTQN